MTEIGSGTYAIVRGYGDVAIKHVAEDDFVYGVREAVFLLHCCHPNIIKINGLSYNKGFETHMNKYAGDMRNIIRGQLIPMEEVYRHAHQILSAVNYLHHRGIIHCDIKPENILMEDGDSPNLVLCDFGISMLSHEAKHSSHVQTVTYRAPEIDIRKNSSIYSYHIDMWSVGALLYYILTGSDLFNAVSDIDQTISITSVFEIQSDSQSRRIKLLKDLPVSYIVDKLKAKVKREDSTIDQTYYTLMANCLLPDRKKRISSQTALELICCIRCIKNMDINPQPLCVPKYVSLDDAGVMRVIPSEILSVARDNYVNMAEHIYQQTQSQLGSLFLGAAVYSNNVEYIEAIFEQYGEKTTINTVTNILSKLLEKNQCLF